MENNVHLAIPADKVKVLENNVEIVRKLFAVEIAIEPEIKENNWRGVILTTQNSTENLINAQEYVSSVCLPEADSRPPCKYTGVVTEKDTPVAILGSMKQIQCSADKMATTKSSAIVSPSEGTMERPTVLGRTASQGSIGAGKSPWKMESEDSSYDSDYENSDVLSPQPGSCDLKKCGDGSAQHDEVSRTVSDTLAAEFAEYVNTRNVGPASSPSSPSAISVSGKSCSVKQIATSEDISSPLQVGIALEGDDDDQDEAAMEAILLDPSYTSRVEFALKLGYTERQVQIALHKLGPQPGQNELLAELIKLGATASSPRTSEGSSGSSQGVGSVSTEDVTNDPTATAGGDIRQLLASRQECMDPSSNLRPIVIDGSNVAMSHGNKEVFSCRGIKLCVDWFKARGHKDITVFVPKWRKEMSRPDARITDQDILLDLEKERRLVFTPSRFVGGRRLVCYDDRYILKLAAETDGIVVSNDNYRDLANENPEYKKVVDERLLMYSFVNDRFMPPDDPLGRHGPNLDNFLRKHSKIPESLLPPCPYGKKCTYGNKCKYYHPERGNQPQKSVTERLQEQAKLQIQEVKARGNKSRDSSPGDSLKMKLTGTVSAPVTTDSQLLKKTPLARTKSVVSSTLLPKDLIEATVSSAGSELGSKSSMEDLQHRNEPLGTQKLPPYLCSTDVQLSGSFLGSSQFQQPTAGIPNLWSSVSPTQGWPHSNIRHPSMQNIGPTPPSSRLFSGDQGGHLSVAKRLSDPDKSESNPGPNLHRKLQRQLTLNPTCDPRLFQDCQCAPSAHIPLQPATSLKGSRLPITTEVDSLPSHSMGVHDPMLNLGGHRPLSRHNSATEPHNLPSAMLPPQMCWDKASRMTMPSADSIHATVTRIASAPDSYCQWPSAHGRNPPMQRLNSTSDSQLNLAHDSPGYYGGALYDAERHGWALHRLPHMGAASPWHHESPTGAIPRPHTPLGHMSQQPMRPSSVPPHQVGLSGQQMPVQFCSDNSRNCLYFHLSSIFPQEQVQAAMMMFPEDVEITPQDLCARILSMFPPRTQ